MQRSGRVIPFPLARRRVFIQRQAAAMARFSHRGAEKHLAEQLRVQRNTLTRRGVSPERIEAELRAMELAIRAELWRVVLLPGGAA